MTNALPMLLAADSSGITWQHSLPLWPFNIPALLIGAALVAGGYWVIQLYRAQQRVAPSGIITALTFLRLALLTLVLILILRPALTWQRKANSAGTLWFMVDRSLSMGLTDPQSTNVERLRWADALGYLPKDARPGKPDVAAARIAALAQSWSTLKPSSTAALSAAADPQALADFLTRIGKWRDRADAGIKIIRADSVAGGADGQSALQALQNASALAGAGLRNAREARTLSVAASDSTIDWSTVTANLNAALRDMNTLAERSDANFLARRGGDPVIDNALARVSGSSRADLEAQALLTSNKRGDTNLLSLVPNYRTKIVAFADTAQAVSVPDAKQFSTSLQEALTLSGKATSLAAGLKMVSEQSTGQFGGGSVVILSDGRDNVPGDAGEPARLLNARGIRVYTLTVGSQQVSPDVAVEQPDAPEWVFKDDTVKASAKIRLDGLEGQTIRVEFVRDGRTLDAKAVTAHGRQDVQSVFFSDKPGDPKVYQYEIRAVPDPAETNKLNNEQKFRVAVKKDKLSVLVVEDIPRWQWQFLRNNLLADPSLNVQSVLLSPAQIRGVARPPGLDDTKASPSNPRPDAGRLPETLKEWEAFDVVILGDIPPEELSNQQQQFIQTCVRDRGMTLVVLSGQRAMPGRYRGTPLAELLPIDLAADPWTPQQIEKHLKSGFRPAVSPEAGGTVLAQWNVDTQANSQDWAQMPAWFWHSTFTQAKPAAGVIWWIAEGAGAGNENIRQRALLSHLSVGIGRVLFLASDQTWRLRNILGQDLDARLWGQIIRWAVGSDLPAGGRFVRFGANKPQLAAGDPVTITIRVLREDLTPFTGLEFQVQATQVSPSAGAATPGATPTADRHVVASVGAHEQAEAPGYYHATFPGLPAGTLDISLKGPTVEDLLNKDSTATQKTLLLQILPQVNVEQRDMNTNPAQMLAIAEAGGGVSLQGPYSDVLAETIPQLEQSYTSTEQIGFFTDPKDPNTARTHWVFLIAFAVVLAAEWALRKKAGLI